MLSETNSAPATFHTPITKHPATADASRIFAASKPLARNAEIFGEDEPATHVYKVVSGAARAYRLLDDGRRQIIAFYLPGDLFGFESSGVHLCSAEAICTSVIATTGVSLFLKHSTSPAGHAQGPWSLMAGELSRTQDRLTLLMRSAEERVAYFLLEMSRRAGNRSAITLPMPRQDIADYLGITIETVSRTLSHLEQSGIISLRTSRQIDLCRCAALAERRSPSRPD